MALRLSAGWKSALRGNDATFGKERSAGRLTGGFGAVRIDGLWMGAKALLGSTR